MSANSQSETYTSHALQKPKMFAVKMHNDDFTSQDFVVFVLKKVFHKNESDAEIIMLDIHNGEGAVVGVYTFDIALTKKLQAEQMAAEKGFPLRLSLLEADS